MPIKNILLVDDSPTEIHAQFQACRALTTDETTKHIPVILCTTKNQETDKIWGLRQGAKDYVTKPVDPAELLAKIAAQG